MEFEIIWQISSHRLESSKLMYGHAFLNAPFDQMIVNIKVNTSN